MNNGTGRSIQNRHNITFNFLSLKSSFLPVSLSYTYGERDVLATVGAPVNVCVSHVFVMGMLLPLAS